MLEVLQLFAQVLALASSTLLILGLIRPVLVLWFLDRFNRLKVIQVYGVATLLFLGLSILFWVIK